MSDKNYRRSNQIERIDLYISKTAKRLVGELMSCDETDHRQRCSEELLFELDQLAEITPCRGEDHGCKTTSQAGRRAGCLS